MKNYYDLENGNVLIQLKNKNLNTLINGNNHNINVAVAAAITSYSRIFMAQFKNNPLYKLYYIKTFSLAQW